MGIRPIESGIGSAQRISDTTGQQTSAHQDQHVAATSIEEIAVSKEMLANAVKKANDVSQIITTHVQFQMHEQSGRYYVAVLNDQTDEVIREIPSKKFLDMVAAMNETLKGIFVDHKK